MEITGNGQMIKKDIWLNLIYSYKYFLKVTLGTVLVSTFLVLLFIKYYLDTTYLGVFYRRMFEQYGGELWLTVMLLAILFLLLFSILSILADIMKYFNRAKLSLGRQVKVLMNPSGITITSDKIGEREVESIDWNVVENIKIKKRYMHIYTKSAPTFHFIIPLRYFSEDNLLEKINHIRTAKEVIDQ